MTHRAHGPAATGDPGGRHRRTAATVAVMVAASLGAGVLAAGTAASSSADELLPGPLPAPAPLSASALAPAATGPQASFYVGLRRKDGGAAKAVRAVSRPGSSDYRDFPSRQDIGRKYGVSTSDLSVLLTAADKAGVRATLDRTGVFARVTGTPAALKRFFGVRVKTKTIPAKDLPSGIGVVRVNALAGKPRYAKRLRPVITETVRIFLSWDTRSSRAREDAPAPTPSPTLTPLPNPAPAPTNQGTYDGCALDPALQPYVYSYNQIAKAYGSAELRRSAGKVTPRLAIISLGDGFEDDMLATSASCFGLSRSRFTRVAAPGLVGRLPAVEGEGNLDTQIAQAVLPARSRVHVIESVSPESQWFAAFATAYALPRVPDVATASYGACEPVFASTKELGTPAGQVRTLTEAVLSRLALAGTSVLVSAGDDGSSDCIEVSEGADGQRAVDYPASSPNVLGIGGTRLAVNAANERTDEVTWNDSAYVLGAPGGTLERLSGAGGGGTSALFERPWWQPLGVTAQSTRTVPDLALHSATTPGWPLAKTPSSAGFPVITPVAGTSAATPYTAANLAIMAALERKAGRSGFGLVAPSLYRLYGRDTAAFYGTAAFDVTQGDNDEYGVGCCTAGPGYDLTTGLGVPRFATLLQQLRTLR